MIALISVYDKTGVEAFARRLKKLGWRILSTGKTARFLKDSGIPAEEVSEYTGFPEILGGRVKTLHPKIHAGILAGVGVEDQKTLASLQIELIDLVCVNLYPFEQKPNIENIDIGGPTMLRAAAKNFERVTVVCDPADYERVAMALETGAVPPELRRELAGKVFERMTQYESAIADFFKPPVSSLQSQVSGLRYGENPHQKASFCPSPGVDLFWNEPLQGKELSYNNILDADAAWWLIGEFHEEPFACAVLKHANPCGVAVSKKSLVKAFEKALSCDPTSAFGGIVVFNREVDPICAEALAGIFLEVILAPGFSGEAREILAKKKNLRLLVTKGDVSLGNLCTVLRSAGGGLLIQEPDRNMEHPEKCAVKTKRKPTAEELRALAFAWKVVKHVKSNAIVFAAEDRTLGIGAGQMSRIDAVKLAVSKAGQQVLKGSSVPVGKPQADLKTCQLENLPTCVCASDAFFPFADNIEAIAQTGATAVIQPGGSVRDPEVIAAADRHNLAMVFTGVRHFRH